MLNVVVWPCKNKERRKKKSTSDRTYKTLITYSEARISIIATNKVGSSPPLEIVIPAVKHLSSKCAATSVLAWVSMYYM